MAVISVLAADAEERRVVIQRDMERFEVGYLVEIHLPRQRWHDKSICMGLDFCDYRSFYFAIGGIM